MLEDRRILMEDIQKVIHHAETTGQKLIQESTGHCKASHAPYKATFWVEYSPQEDGFIVHNAYSHRMEVSGRDLHEHRIRSARGSHLEVPATAVNPWSWEQ